MAIACAYCDGEHDTPAQVRQCWNDGGQAEVGLTDSPLPEPESAFGDRSGDLSVPATAPSPTPSRAVSGDRTPGATLERGVAPAGAGPDELARNLVVDVGGSVAPPWSSAQRVVVDPGVLGAPAATLVRLRAAAHALERVVIELAAPFEREPMLMTEAAPYELGPTFAFDLEELHHLVWSNSVDGRDPSTPVWIGLDRAVAAGAVALASGSPGDVQLPDGSVVWLDGGPVRHRDPVDGVAVLHVVAAEHGSLRPPAANVSHADLAPDQLAAVTHPGGGARIIAPAGSGKTRVLTERARHLLTAWNLPSSAISLVAFNKRAQEEMRERTTDLPGLQVRTLNAIALAIVNGTPPFAAQPQTWRTIGEPDVRRIIGDLVDFPRRRNSDPIGPWIEALTVIRLGLIEPGEVEGRYDGDVDGLAAAWPGYRTMLERRGAVDFDDQIYRALLVLLRDPQPDGSRSGRVASCSSTSSRTSRRRTCC